VSSVVLVLRVVLSLVVVLGLLALAARYAGRKGLGGTPTRGRTAAKVEVVARQGLGRNTSVVIVRAAERALVLGVTETGISLLADADPSVLDLREETPDPSDPDAQGMGRTGGPVARPSAWKDTLELLRERTVRRS
jgi:flagellar protein FliO/FliZ